MAKRPKGRPKKYRSLGLVYKDYPPGIIDVAKTRVMAHLEYFRMVNYNLHQLLVNVYCQGIHDMAETLVERGEYVEKIHPPINFLPEGAD